MNAVETLRRRIANLASDSQDPFGDEALAAVETLLEAAHDELIRRGCLCLYSRCPLHGESEGALAAAVRRVEAGQ